MSETPEPPLRRDRRRGASAPRRRRRVSVFGVIGELLITAGVVLLLYVAWQLWIGDMIYGVERNAEAHSLSEEWAAQASASPTATPTPTETSTSAPTAEPEDITVEPVILPEVADTEVFGIMYIPRFGDDYARKVGGGTTRSGTLDPIGVGHYLDTPMPGSVGNFAVAAHRTTYSAPFNRIADLHVGDAIVIETEVGWYTYRFRTLEYVTPDSVDVLAAVPQELGVEANGRYMTMTSCSPMYSMTERIVGYSVFESFTPYADGPPAALTDGVDA